MRQDLYVVQSLVRTHSDQSATRYGVSTFQLALVNEAVVTDNCDNLQPDQTICLGIEQHDCTKVYTVVENEYVEFG